MNKSISLVILVYNEIVGLKSLFDQIPHGSIDEIFAVDGGSTDGSKEFLESKGIPVYGQEIKGRGEAFRIAFAKSKGEALLFFSPDGNENPKDIPRFRPFLEQGYDMVIATRMVKGARNEEDDQIFKWRKWANNAFNLMANWTWNQGPFVTDSINGYRAITKKAWGQITPDGPGYTIEYQSTIRCLKNNLKIAEFPTCEYNRIDQREGSPSLATGWAFLKLYFAELS